MSIYDYLVLNTPLEYSNKIGLNKNQSSSFEPFEIYDHDFFNSITSSTDRYKKSDSLSDLVIVEDKMPGTNKHPVVMSVVDYSKSPFDSESYTSSTSLTEGGMDEGFHEGIHEGFSIQDPYFSNKEMDIRAFDESILSKTSDLQYKNIKSCGCNKNPSQKKYSKQTDGMGWDLSTKIYISSLTVVGLYIFYRTLKNAE